MVNVTLAQITAFQSIVRLGSFHAAAAELGLTQPAISQRVRELEDTLGVKLFERNGRRMRISPDGATLIPYTEQMLRTNEELILRLRSHDPLQGTLRLGLSETFALICLTPLLRQLNRQYAGLKTAVHVGDTGTLSDLLNRQQLDLAVISEPQVEERVRREPVGVNQHGWFASARYDIASKGLTPADLCRHHLIVTPPPARLHATATRWFSEAGVTPRRLSMCNSLWVTMQTITSGLAIGLVPTRVMQDGVRRREVRELAVRPVVEPHKVWICYQVNELGPGLQQVVAAIRALMAELKVFGPVRPAR